MRFTLGITMDNAAFDEPGPELRTLLYEVKRQIENDVAPGSSGMVRDTNGNTVGKWRVTA